MALKTKVKVGKINNLSDARYCAGMGVDMLGFPVGGSDGITAEKFKEINGWITGPDLVLEFSSPEHVSGMSSSFYGNYFEVKAAWLPEIPASETPLIVRLTAAEWPRFREIIRDRRDIALVLVENFDTSDRNVVEDISSALPCFVESAKLQEGLEDFLDLPITGISLQGSDELRPGLKDYGHLAEILEQLDTD